MAGWLGAAVLLAGVYLVALSRMSARRDAHEQEAFADEFGFAYRLARPVPWWRSRLLWLEARRAARRARRQVRREGTRLEALRELAR